MVHSDNDPQPPPPANETPFQKDTFRILVATDNHIGVNERDPVRSQDSINTFKEILQLAVKHEVDFILLGGDLFHENKPSRDSLYQTTALLRQYTLGEKPVQFELLSDPNEGAPAGYPFPAINYEDPNYNISIPVFSIHGNHDDPQGVGAEGALCALDLLSVSGLINYMGKFDLPENTAEAASTGIAVRPVLLRKGDTYLGLYGIGNVKDQRMHFELRSNRVRMYMPREKEDWFNVLLVHQNRAKRGPQEYVPEGMFDDSIDLVIWGHEHDCRITPEPVADKEYHIVQPGSSVATSLADGEAIEKHVGLLEVQGKEYNLTPISLRTVRPFVLGSVVLLDVAEEEGLDITSSVEVTKYLKQKVTILIEQANASWDDRNARAVEAGDEELPSMLPIIRLKVDTTGVSTMTNPVRFGQDFAGLIANPRDLLVFHRSKKLASSRSKISIDQPELSVDDPDLTNSEKLAKVRVGTLVREYLAAQELQLLGESGMSDAIQTFVEKDDVRAIQTHVAETLRRYVHTVKPGEEVEEQELEELLTNAKERHEQEYIMKGKTKAARGKGKAAAQDQDEESDAASVDSMAMDVDGGGGGGGGSDLDSDDPPPKKCAPTKKAAPAAKKAPAKGKGKKVVQSDSDNEEIEIPEDDEVYSDDEPPPAKPAKKSNRATVLSQTTAAPKKTPAKKAGTSKQSTLSFAKPAARGTRAAATKARGKMAADVDSDDSG